MSSRNYQVCWTSKNRGYVVIIAVFALITQQARTARADAGLDEGGTPDSGSVSVNLPNGTPCNDGTQCTSSFCVDGVCCSSACDGQCEACDVPPYPLSGQCMAVQGNPHGPRPPCENVNGSVCGSTSCDGAHVATCTPVVSGALAADGGTVGLCGSECVASTDGGSSSSYFQFGCDGLGQCTRGGAIFPLPIPCGAYICDPDAGACKTSCDSDSDCVNGTVCTTGTDASPPNTCVPPCQVAHDCPPPNFGGGFGGPSCAVGGGDNMWATSICALLAWLAVGRRRTHRR